MTFILGSRCKDGVILIADKKITSINELQSITFEYKPKMHAILRHVIFASSGSTDTYELFRDDILNQAKSSQGFSTFDNVVIKLADIVLDVNKKRDFKSNLYFELMVAVQPENNQSILTRITGYGTKHLVEKYHTVGIGGIFVNHFLQTAWYPEITMEKASGLGYFLIKYIEDFKLHSSVGVDKYYPQIWFVPDDERDEKGEKIDYEVNPQTRPELFERIKKDAFLRLKKQKRSMKQ